MEVAEASRASAAAMQAVSDIGLVADEAITLHNSNKLTLRLLPCDLVARVARGSRHAAQFEVDLAAQLSSAGCPVAALDPRMGPVVYERGGFMITLWTYYPSTTTEIEPSDYASALQKLHAGMRAVIVPAPHFMDRVAQALRIVASSESSPALGRTIGPSSSGRSRT